MEECCAGFFYFCGDPLPFRFQIESRLPGVNNFFVLSIDLLCHRLLLCHHSTRHYRRELTMTQAEYEKEIRDIAYEAMKDADGDRDAAYENILDACDSHKWVIYTAYNYDVLKFSSNDNAGIEEGTVDANQALKEGGLARLTMQLACAAMIADATEVLSEIEAD